MFLFYPEPVFVRGYLSYREWGITVDNDWDDFVFVCHLKGHWFIYSHQTPKLFALVFSNIFDVGRGQCRGVESQEMFSIVLFFFFFFYCRAKCSCVKSRSATCFESLVLLISWQCWHHGQQLRALMFGHTYIEGLPYKRASASSVSFVTRFFLFALALYACRCNNGKQRPHLATVVHLCRSCYCLL